MFVVLSVVLLLGCVYVVTARPLVTELAACQFKRGVSCSDDDCLPGPGGIVRDIRYVEVVRVVIRNSFACLRFLLSL